MVSSDQMQKCVFGVGLFLLGIFSSTNISSAATMLNNKEIVANQARFTVITPQCIRMEYNHSGKFVDEPSYFAANRNAHYLGAKVTQGKDTISIDTGVINLVYKADGKPFSTKNLHATIRQKGKFVEWTPGMTNEENLGGAICTLDVWDGAGKLSDGLLSRNGWYLLDDSRGPLLTKDWVKSRPSDAGTDWYLFGYGHDYKAALKSLTQISGNIPLPRKYMFGVWYSRYWPYTSAEYHQIVHEYAEHDFPLDNIVMDMDWHKDGWTGWSWNDKLLPDHSDLLKWFHDQGLRVTLNLHPADGVQPHEDMYADFMRAMGEDPASKKILPYDATNKRYMDTLFKYTHDPLTKEGVDFWWLDWQAALYTRGVPELTNIEWLNEYYTNYTSKNGNRGASFSRWGGWGDQRHPVHFSGDTSTTWRMLAFEVPFTSASGNSGCFFWTHDIGGHGRGRNEESYVRWCQFGAFSAVMRSHSTRDASLDRRPWTYPKWAEDSMRISMHLRSIFFPYTYSSAQESCSQSIPLIRPMYFDYPEEDAAYKQPQQYFYGDTILAAPVTEPGIGKRKLARQAVWFPKGNWYNYFTGERFTGGEHLVTSTINEFPLFIRGGVPVPMQNYTPRMGSFTPSNLVIRCYPGTDGKTGSFTLYEDDGVSDAYKRGAFATTKLSYSRAGNHVTVTIAPTEHSYKEQLTEREYTIELPCTLPARNIEIDGIPAKAVYNADKHLNTLKIAKRSIRKGSCVTLEVSESSAEDAMTTAFAYRVGLPAPAKGTSLKNLLVSALTHPGDLNSQRILASAGVGVFDKVETVYGFPDSKTIRIYNNPAVKADIKNVLVDPDDPARHRNTKISLDGREVLSEESEVGLDVAGLRGRNALDSAKVTVSSYIYPAGMFGKVWWLSNGSEGQWVKLDWDTPRTLDTVALYDLGYWGSILAGKLEFSDGTSINIDNISRDPSQGSIIRFSPRKVSWMKFTATKVSPDGPAGLSDLVVLESNK